MEDITNADYKHAKEVWEIFEIESLGDYHDLYVQSDTSLIADIIENFQNNCTETYKLDPAQFYSAPG